MLKKRLIAIILTKGPLIVQSFGFKKYLPLGNVKTAIEFFVNWDVDEIILIDIDASKKKQLIDIKLIKWALEECFIPITIGGGIKYISDVRNIIKFGADKICINSVVRENPDFVKKCSHIFGSQCITVSLDVIQENGFYKVYDYLKKETFNEDPRKFAERIENLGAGEILLNFVNRDGSAQGYDLKLLKMVSEAVSIPVIATGGAGKPKHLSEGILTGKIQAVAAANMFQHTEHSTISAKAQLRKDGIDVRLNSKVKYENFSFDKLGRPF